MTWSPEYLIAFSIGFFGSLHCIGMCGPIALAVPSLKPSLSGRITGGLIYNLGRISTYVLLGLILGFVGKGIAIFKWQQAFSLIAGALILFYVLFPQLLRFIGSGSTSTALNNYIKNLLVRFLNRKSVGGLLGVGFANGLLPCGLVYLAIAGSIDMGSPLQGGFFMAFFGLGTLPMMLGVYMMGFNLKGTAKNKLSRLIPVFAFAIGVLFILRGLGLGIPYVSPSFDPHEGDVNCHLPEHRH